MTVSSFILLMPMCRQNLKLQSTRPKWKTFERLRKMSLIYACVISFKPTTNIDRQAELNDEESWHVQRDADGIRSMYRPDEDSSRLVIRLEGLIDAPLFDVLAIWYEVDLHKLWMPSFRSLGLKESKLLQNPLPTKLLVQMLYGIPWPMENRDLLFRVDGIDCVSVSIVYENLILSLDGSRSCRTGLYGPPVTDSGPI